MENLPKVLAALNVPDDKLAVVQTRVEARLSRESEAEIGKWCAEFRAHADALLGDVPRFDEEFGFRYRALRVLLVREGIVTWQGEHGIAVPDEEVDRKAKPTATPARPSLPAHMLRVGTPALPAAPVPSVVAPTPPPVTAKQAVPSADVVDVNTATPVHRDTIRGMYVERADGSWVLECDVFRGDKVQICTIMDDGRDHAVPDQPLPQGGAQRFELQLPAGRRPVKVVIIVLDAAGSQVGGGMIGADADE